MENSGMYQLIMRQGPRPGEISSLSKQVVTVGRDGRNDITINDPEVSRQHARFSLQMEGYVIEDMGSTNGTFVNGTRVTGPRLLSDGDEVGFGETIVLVYQAFAGEAIETVMSPHAGLDAFPEPTAVAVPPPPFEIGTTPDPGPPPPMESEAPPEPAPAPPFMADPLPPPPPTFSSLPEPPAPPPPQFSSEPTPPAFRPPAMATPVEPPSYTPPAYDPPVYEPSAYEPSAYEPPAEEEKKPANRKRLLIGCGCLVLLVICVVAVYLLYTVGLAIWDAPPEFWEDPFNNFDLLFGIIAPLVTL